MRRRKRTSGKPHARLQRVLARSPGPRSKPMVATEPTEPTITPTTALDGGEYDYDQNYDDIYDDIGGIYDSCDDYNYDSDPADDR